MKFKGLPTSKPSFAATKATWSNEAKLFFGIGQKVTIDIVIAVEESLRYTIRNSIQPKGVEEEEEGNDEATL